MTTDHFLDIVASDTWSFVDAIHNALSILEDDPPSTRNERAIEYLHAGLREWCDYSTSLTEPKFREHYAALVS